MICAHNSRTQRETTDRIKHEKLSTTHTRSAAMRSAHSLVDTRCIRRYKFVKCLLQDTNAAALTINGVKK